MMLSNGSFFYFMLYLILIWNNYVLCKTEKGFGGYEEFVLIFNGLPNKFNGLNEMSDFVISQYIITILQHPKRCLYFIIHPVFPNLLKSQQLSVKVNSCAFFHFL